MVEETTLPAFMGPMVRLNVSTRTWSPFAFFQSSGAGDKLAREFTLEKQSQTEWCWAAVASAVTRYLDTKTVGQCQIVDRHRPNLNCCAQPGSDPCNKPAALSDVLFQMGNRRGETIAGDLTPAELRQELNSDRPVCVGLLHQGSGHFVVVTGCGTAQGATFVTLKDPAVGNSEKTVSYADLRFGYRGHWVQTYLTKKAPA